MIVITQFKGLIIESEMKTNPEFDENNLIFKFLGFIHIIIGLVFVFIWFKITGTIIIMEGWREIYRRHKES